jgi:tetratricopeptide (TPR) repeat protein
VRAVALLLLVAAGPAAAGASRSPAAAGVAEAGGALGRLLDEDVEGARPAIEAGAAAHPQDPNARLALGLLRFYEHRYDEAVQELEAAAPGQDPTGYLRLARNAAALTRRSAEASSDHFTVAYPKGKDEVLVPYLLETLEAQRAALEQDLGLAPAGRVRVEILETPADLSRLSSLSEAEIRGSGTIALCKYGKLMMVSPKALIQGYDWLDTAAHEFTHTVVTLKTGNRAPIWLQEGVAKWEETRWRGAGGEDFSPISAALVRRALEANQLVTFEQMHPSMAKLPTQEMAALAYAEVVLMVELVVERGGPPLLSRVLDLVGQGTEADIAVAQGLGVSWPEAQAAWRRHMASRPLPRGGAQALQRLRFKDDPKQAGPWVEWADLPDQPSRDHARLGQLFRERGRWLPARVEYRKAIDRAGARVPILAHQYAIAAAMTGQKVEAEQVLNESIGWNPDYAALRVELARLLLERQEFAPARLNLVAANRQDPFDPEIHAGLALCAEALGEAAMASRERRFAEILKRP